MWKTYKYKISNSHKNQRFEQVKFQYETQHRTKFKKMKRAADSINETWKRHSTVRKSRPPQVRTHSPFWCYWGSPSRQLLNLLARPLVVGSAADSRARGRSLRMSFRIYYLQQSTITAFIAEEYCMALTCTEVRDGVRGGDSLALEKGSGCRRSKRPLTHPPTTDKYRLTSNNTS